MRWWIALLSLWEHTGIEWWQKHGTKGWNIYIHSKSQTCVKKRNHHCPWKPKQNYLCGQAGNAIGKLCVGQGTKKCVGGSSWRCCRAASKTSREWEINCYAHAEWLVCYPPCQRICVIRFIKTQTKINWQKSNSLWKPKHKCPWDDRQVMQSANCAPTRWIKMQNCVPSRRLKMCWWVALLSLQEHTGMER